MRRKRRDHRTLYRADIRDDRPALQTPDAISRRDVFVGAHRRAEHHAVGVPDSLAPRSVVTSSPRPSASAPDHNSEEASASTIRLASAARARCARHRRADEPDSDDRQLDRTAVRERRPKPLSHAPPRMNSESAATTPRLASSVPTVMRRQSGRP